MAVYTVYCSIYSNMDINAVGDMQMSSLESVLGSIYIDYFMKS